MSLIGVLRCKGLAALVFLVSCSTVPPEVTAQERAMLDAPPAQVLAQVEAKLPRWQGFIDSVEAEALARGRGLTPKETAMAQAVGVKAPQRVRLHLVERLPRAEGQRRSLLSFTSVSLGLTSGYGITLATEEPEDWLLAHELVHVAQFERLGRAEMLRRYLTETLILPGTLIPLEREAIATGAKVADGAGTYAF